MISRLGQREKLVLWVGIVFVALFLVWALAVDPALAYRAKVERKIKKLEKARTDLLILAQEYQQLKAKESLTLAKFGRHGRDFKLFTFLDKLADESKVKSHVKYMKPSVAPIPDSPYKNSTVEMKLTGLSMGQLSDYLYRIESAPQTVSIRRIAITEAGRGERKVDAVIQVTTLES